MRPSMEIRNREADLEKEKKNWEVRTRVLGKDRFNRNVENVDMCRN
jgi:hypothetical protein